MSKNPRADEIRIDPDIERFFGKPIYTYTSEQATEDGFLMDLDLLVTAKIIKPSAQLPIKYITTSLLELGYWTERCINGVKITDAGTNDRCGCCPEFAKMNQKGKLQCSEKTLNIANLYDLLVAALQIFNKKVKDDWFVSGNVELPNGKKQKVFIALNEKNRYTLMLPEDY